MYYVSKVLQGSETRYPFTEKVALALLNATRKLRPYLQAHSIIVLMDQPLGVFYKSLNAPVTLPNGPLK